MLRWFRKAGLVLLMLSGCSASFAQVLAPYPTATLTIAGSATSASGIITVDFNGFLESASYGQYSSPSSIASALAAMFSRDYISMGLYAKAGAHGPLVDPTVVTFQLVNGSSFGPVNVVATSSPFTLTASGFASSTATVVDRGIATLVVAGQTVTSSYGDGSTASTIAQDLAAQAAANSSLASIVAVTSEGPNIFLQSKQTTGSFSYPYSLGFSTSTSFSGAPTAGTLTSSADTQTVPVYSYNITYDGAGNPKTLNDSVMGSWTYGYDTLNRLTSGASVSGTEPSNPYLGKYTCWSYDSFGNRTFQSVSATPCSGTPAATLAASYSVSNQVSAVSAPVGLSVTYDAAGNVKNDGYNQYLYDAESRICAVFGPEGLVGYQYDADGNRIGKGTFQGNVFPSTCDITQNGYEPMTNFVLDQSGGQMTEVSVANNQTNWVHSNVTANGVLLASYDTLGLHFHLNDALGSRRAQVDPAGFPEQTCQSLPFGDQLYCSGSLTAPTEHHFTGKERDTESGLDYFGARYYSSNMGRFMSPDWSEAPDPVPYASLRDPQTLNLYSYVRNNPLSDTDEDGHCDTKTQDVVCIVQSIWHWLNSGTSNQAATAVQATSSFAVHSTIVGMNTYNRANNVVQQHPAVANAANVVANAAMIMGTDGLGGAAEAGMEAAEAIEGVASEIQFGSNANQDYHAFRHIEEAGLDKDAVKQAIEKDLAGVKDSLPGGLKKGTVTVGGKTVDYHAFKLPSGVVNVGRITVR